MQKEKQILAVLLGLSKFLKGLMQVDPLKFQGVILKEAEVKL